MDFLVYKTAFPDHFRRVNFKGEHAKYSHAAIPNKECKGTENHEKHTYITRILRVDIHRIENRS